ncbi:MAG: biopolymer transporter ExbD [Leptospiraceae bacterium]
MKFPPLSKKSNVMDIAPMVDLVFLLLVFFMVGSKFASPSLEMELPSASSGNNSESENIIISVDRHAKIYLAGNPVDQSSLTRRLTELITEKPETQVLLRADGKITYDLFVQIMDRTRKAGVQNLRLEYEPK